MDDPSERPVRDRPVCSGEWMSSGMGTGDGCGNCTFGEEECSAASCIVLLASSLLDRRPCVAEE